jgi:glutamate carboxypeptidase
VRILLNGHYDTVFGPEHAFQSCTETGDGLMIGPGVADMKGGLLVLLEALRRFETLPCASRIGWQVLLTPDEEIGSPHGGPALVSAASGHHLALIFESSPPDGRIIRGRPAVGRFTLEMKGRSAHAGRAPRDGRNALVRLAAVCQQVASWDSAEHGILCNLARFHAEAPLNVVPDRATAEFGARATRQSAMREIEDRLAALKSEVSAEDGFSLEWSGAFTRPPKEITPGDEALFARLCRIAAQMGLTLEWSDSAGASDAGLPVIDSLGVIGGGLHSDTEFAVLESLPERVALTVGLLADIAISAGTGAHVP